MFLNIKFLSILGIIVQVCLIVSHTDIPGIPEDILDAFIKKHVDLSIDPCDDFYAHVCNRRARGEFAVQLYEYKMSIIEKSWKKYSYAGVTNLELSKHSEAMKKIQDKRYYQQNLCTQKNVNFFLEVAGKNVTSRDCKGVYQKIKSIVKKIEHTTIFLARIARALIVYNEIKFLDKEVRELFTKIIAEMRYMIENTGWIKDKGVTQKYLKTLDGMKLFTYRNFEKLATDFIDNYLKLFNQCIEKYQFPSNLQESLCILYGVHISTTPIRHKSIVVGTFSASEIQEVLEDDFAVFNSRDENVIIGTDFLLLVNSKYISSVYGSIGYIMSHELMHTFIFDKHDKKAPLYQHWTKDTACIKQQSKKTCQTYRTAACSQDHKGHDHTFEEDGADYMGYHLAHNMFRKQNFQRKQHVNNIDNLNKEQLFFYGAATVFCDHQSYDFEYDHRAVHSNHYQRINSMASQIDGFAQAFNCSATDKIVQNKAAHCEIYGSSTKGKDRDQDIGRGGYQNQNEDQDQDQDQDIDRGDQDGYQVQDQGRYQDEIQYRGQDEQGGYQDQDEYQYQDQGQGGRGELGRGRYQDQYRDEYEDQGGQGRYQDQNQYPYSGQLGQGRYQDQDQYDRDGYEDQDNNGGWFRKSTYNQTDSQVNIMESEIIADNQVDDIPTPPDYADTDGQNEERQTDNNLFHVV